MSAYLDTRVSLFAGRLWRDEALDALVDAADETVAATLTQRGLSQLAASFINPADRQDSRSLEQRIIAQILGETRVLIRPLSGDARSFLTFWTARFEISNVKTLLRSKLTGERPAAVLARLTPMGIFGRLDNQDLAHAEDVAEGLTLHAQALENAVGAPFRSLMAHLIDRINLVWLLRYRFNYGLPPAQVYYLLVGSRYSLPGARLQELAALDSRYAVVAALLLPLRTLLVRFHRNFMEASCRRNTSPEQSAMRAIPRRPLINNTVPGDRINELFQARPRPGCRLRGPGPRRFRRQRPDVLQSHRRFGLC